MEYAVAFIAVSVMGYALVERRLVTTIFTGPIVFMTLGYIGGDRGFDLIDQGRSCLLGWSTPSWSQR